jgi:hypothetical protein
MLYWAPPSDPPPFTGVCYPYRPVNESRRRRFHMLGKFHRLLNALLADDPSHELGMPEKPFDSLDPLIRQ